jgi:DNA-binding beta-propeller fold protein YncE
MCRRPRFADARLITSLIAAGALIVGSGVGTGVADARPVTPRDVLVSSLDLSPLSPNDIVIDPTGTYAYVVTCTRGPTAEILRLNLSTFSVDDSALLTSDCARSVVMQDDSIYVTTNDRLYRLDAATFGPSGPSTSDYVAIDSYGNALDVYGSYAYIGHHAGSSGDKITKVNISSTPMTVTSSFPSGGNYPMSLEVNPSGTFAYVTHTISHSLSKIRLSDDSVVGSLQVGMQPYGLAIDDAGTYAYVPSAGRESFSTLNTPPWLVRVRLSDFTFDDSVTLPFYWAFGVDVNDAGTTAYVGQDREGSNVAKVNLGPSMSIDETITVQNSPTSLAISPTAPYVYTANSADLNGRTVSKVAIIGSTPAPTVSGLSVTSGPLTGGSTVTISGDNLTGATAVSFGGTAATILSGTDDTVAVTVPAAGSAGARNVTVTTPGGTSTPSVTYTYVAAPSVTTMVPTSGLATGGTPVTITGTNLSNATVEVHGTPVTPTTNTSTSIGFTAPAAAAGTANVTVTTTGGTAAAGTFTYLAPPLPVAPAAPERPGAVPGDSSALVSWSPVSATGTFPISTYQVTSLPSGGSCLTSALSCEISGLANGTAYTFSVRALSGAGWGAWSVPSTAVTPVAAERPRVVISGTRKGQPRVSVVTVTGRSNLTPGTSLRPWVRLAGSPGFRQGSAVIVVDDTGSFTWSRRTDRTVTLYVRTPDGSVASNRITIR